MGGTPCTTSADLAQRTTDDTAAPDSGVRPKLWIQDCLWCNVWRCVSPDPGGVSASRATPEPRWPVSSPSGTTELSSPSSNSQAFHGAFPQISTTASSCRRPSTLPTSRPGSRRSRPAVRPRDPRYRWCSNRAIHGTVPQVLTSTS